MKATVYLPDEIYKDAKRAQLNLSRLLRDAVTAELDRLGASMEGVEGETVKLDLGDRFGRINGVVDSWNYDDKASDERKDVYLRNDLHVFVYDQKSKTAVDYTEALDELREAIKSLTDDDYVEIMRKLGVKKPTVDL